MTESMWLRSQTAQRDFLTLISYGTAFAGSAAIQALSYGLTAPRVYWAALGRAAAKGPHPEIASTPEDAAAPITPEPDPAPAAVASPNLLDAPRAEGPDDLTALAGIGPKLAQALNEFGIYHYDQIASLDQQGIDWLEAQQKGFRMICGRFDLIGQAKARG